ncbi:hypothetical protein SAMN05216243_2912 [Sediminibacillus albus]|uniref:Uncharacterized protein n=1 Tax=Sediminibacillus albus TaxID=407036 RepID=A0A1G9BAD3_9BACI|nr:hypothetical protein SAMN05216243_2912 [Sediminibacillus albus]
MRGGPLFSVTVQKNFSNVSKKAMMEVGLENPACPWPV